MVEIKNPYTDIGKYLKTHPIVLDLDGSGVDLVGHEASSVFFDWDGDGYAEKTGWAGANDGLLVYDHDGDGKVTQANEISFVGYLTGAKTDLEGLRFFDTNDDGRLDASDTEAAKFKVWQDRDQDGEVDEGEMEGLAAAGIASIGLEGRRVDRTEDGNTVFNEASFTRTDGTTGAVGDVAFTYKTQDFQRAAVTDASGPGRAVAGPSEADEIRAALARAAAGLRTGVGLADTEDEEEDRRLGRLVRPMPVAGAAAPTAELLTLAALGAIAAAPTHATPAPIAPAADGRVEEEEPAVPPAGTVTGDENAPAASGPVVGGDALAAEQGGSSAEAPVSAAPVAPAAPAAPPVEAEAGFAAGETVAPAVTVPPAEAPTPAEAAAAPVLPAEAPPAPEPTTASTGAAEPPTLADWSRVLIGTEGDDVIHAGGRAPLWMARGLGGRDTLVLDRSDDVTLDLDRTSFEIVHGSAGADHLTRRDGTEVLLYGRGGGDALSGGNGDDGLYGGAGADRLAGNGGDDRLLGGMAADVLDGGDGIDAGIYAASADGVTIDLAAGSGTGGAAEGDRLAKIENLIGSGHTDMLAGGAGANRLEGGGGRDVLDGRAGNDALAGGEGDDTLTGGAGADRLDGGLGKDRVRYDRSAAGVTVDLASGAGAGGAAEGDRLSGIEHLAGSGNRDTLMGNGGANRIDGAAGNDRLAGRAGDDALSGGADDDVLAGGAGSDRLDGGAGADLADYGDATGGVVVDLAAGTGSGAEAAGDRLIGVEHLAGSAQDDVLLGDGASNSLAGGSGADRLDGRDGDDALIGAAGMDALEGGSGNDWLDGGADGDRLVGGVGDDTVHAGDGDDAVEAGSGADWIDSGEGSDVVAGGDGTDTIHGGAGADRIDAGSGNDWVDGGDGADRLDAGRGDDTIHAGEGADLVEAGAGDDWADGDAGDDVIAGGAGADMLRGEDGADRIDGGSGGDRLDGGFGDDLLVGGLDADRLDGGDGDDRLLGGSGADTLQGGAGRDIADYERSGMGVIIDLAAGTGSGGDAVGDRLSGVEIVVGSAYGDDLMGDAVGNRLIGGDGDDLLEGGAGADLLEGGSGRDRARYAGSAAAVTVDLGAGTASGGDADGDVLTGIEDLEGGAYGDTLSGDAGANRLIGNDGDDALIGDADDDSLSGGAGDDVLDGGIGGDRIDGGIGVDLAAYAGSGAAVAIDLAAGTGIGGTAEGDTLAGIEDVTGSDHDDRLSGDTAADRLDGGGADDVLDGRSGGDALFGGAGDDRLAGGAGADRLDGGTGRDRASYADAASGVSVSLETGIGTAGEAAGDVLDDIEDLTGSAHADTLVGDDDANAIDGGAGADRLLGGDGTDALGGGAGNDTLWGEVGNDGLDGGAGTDTVRYAGRFDGYRVERGAAGAATVTDTVPGANGDDGRDALTAVERIVFADRTVFLDGTNNRPDARADATTTWEDVGLVIRAADLLANDFDVDRDGLRITGVSDAVNGTVRLLSNGNVEFVPEENFSGVARFTYIVADDKGGTHQATVGVNVTPENDAPRIASYHSGSIYGGESALIEISDEDGSPSDIEVALIESSGRLALISDLGDGRYGLRGFGDFGIQLKVTDADGGERYYTIFGHTVSNGLGGGGSGAGNGGQEKFATIIDAVYEGLVDLPSEPDPNEGHDDDPSDRPIVLDLDGDGVELVGLSETTVRFDMDGDGVRDLTGWAAADDGILAFDHDGDGRVTHRSEIVIADYGLDGMTDLEALAHAFDGNRDGVFDAVDSEWHRFGVWRDMDQDGAADAGEFARLDELGIAGIGLDRTDDRREVDGNTIFGEATFTRTDGSTGLVGDVAFGYRPGAAPPAEADPADDAALDRLIQAMAMFDSSVETPQAAPAEPIIDPAIIAALDDDPAQQVA